MHLTTSARVRPSDAEILEAVLTALARDPRFRAGEIGVEIDDGVVTLTGTVSTYGKLSAAAELAAAIPGVEDVANDLEVHVRGVSARNDTEIARAVREALDPDGDVPAERIDAIVRQGAVSLAGAVERWQEKNAATRAASRVSGVIAVRNELKILPQWRADTELSEDVRSALARILPSRVDGIAISVREGTVTLLGRVLSLWQHRQAEEAAGRVAGVRRIVNQLIVGDPTW